MSLSRRILRLVFLVLQAALLVFGAGVAAAQPAELVLQDGLADGLKVDRGVELLIENEGEALTPQQVLSPTMAGRWKAYARSHSRINLPGERRPVWIRFQVRHAASADSHWVLAIDWPLLEHIDFRLVEPQTGRIVMHQPGGLASPASARPLKDPADLFALDLAPGQRATVLLRVHSRNQLTVPLALWEVREWQARRYDHAVLMGLLFGILAVMFFYNLSLWVFSREPAFRSYAGYLLSIIAYELTITGYGPLYLWGDNTWLKARGYEFFAALSFLAVAVFFRRFLDLGRLAPRHIDYINRGFIVFWAVMTVRTILPLSPKEALLMAVTGLLMSFVAVYSAAYMVARGHAQARYFLLAWTVIIAATFATLLNLAGVIEGGWWLDQSQHIGFVVETVLLSVALADRIKRERDSKEAAQREALMLSRKVEQEREEKLRAQEHALSVQLRANEELELRVLDRTAELKRAMENVELANIELAKLSVTDALTKVHNRRYFDDTLKKEYDRSSRTGLPLALVLADIDHFKRINDSVGHLAGDECLRLVASALSHSVGRSTDLVARYGGEEFAIVLPATDGAHAMEVAERMRRAVEGLQFIYRGQRIPISISLGVVARVCAPAGSVADLLQEADQALYAAKGAGRNRAMLAAA